MVGVSVRRSEVAATEVVTRHGLPTTSVVRTLADLGRRLPLFDAVAAIDLALHKRLLDAADLHTWVDAHPRYPGVARLRRAMQCADPAAESVMETRLRLLLVLAGLPGPKPRCPFTTTTVGSSASRTSITRTSGWPWNTTAQAIARALRRTSCPPRTRW
jgi:hypothetical protein